ncbi:MAG: hypothetical protein GPOALKHO_000605 [Sodalis sp.]|nr:MAG: hypothetical protein GPOALKHO_000605 [Sodalis sp.]
MNGFPLLSAGCCGMAGTYGREGANYAHSRGVLCAIMLTATCIAAARPLPGSWLFLSQSGRVSRVKVSAIRCRRFWRLSHDLDTYAVAGKTQSDGAGCMIAYLCLRYARLEEDELGANAVR